MYLLRLIRSATWMWNRPMIELLGRLLPKDVHARKRGIQRTGMAITEALQWSLSEFPQSSPQHVISP